jgi:hypothetical protein
MKLLITAATVLAVLVGLALPVPHAARAPLRSQIPTLAVSG